MANVVDCIGKLVKISKNSITIKNADGKTSGVVRDIVSLYDMQPNRQIEYYQKLRKAGLHGKICIKDIILCDGELYVFRNVKNKLFCEKHGYFSECEEKKEKEKEDVYNKAREAGFSVIECIFV